MEFDVFSLGIALILLSAIILLVLRIKRYLKQKEKENISESSMQNQKITTENLIEHCSEIVKSVVINVSKLYFLSILSFADNNRKDLSRIKKDIKDLNLKTHSHKKNIFSTIRRLDESEIDSGHYFIQILDRVGDASNCLQSIFSPIHAHIESNHPSLPVEQTEELIKFNEKMAEFFNYSLNILKNNRFESLPELQSLGNEIVNQTIHLKKNQIQYLKNEGKGTKVSLVFLEVMTESKNLILVVRNAVEAQKEFFENSLIKK